MIGISKLYCGTVEPSDALRYGRHSSQLPSHLLQFSADKKPVVVWNVTRRCNLRCVHCYLGGRGGSVRRRPELTTAQWRDLLAHRDDSADELVEVTPQNIRMRKKLLTQTQRLRATAASRRTDE